MGDFDPTFVHTLAQQSWALYGVGMFLILLRMSVLMVELALSLLIHIYRYARIHRLGIRSLQADDYLMAVAGVRRPLIVGAGY